MLLVQVAYLLKVLILGATSVDKNNFQEYLKYFNFISINEHFVKLYISRCLNHTLDLSKIMSHLANTDYKGTECLLRELYTLHLVLVHWCLFCVLLCFLFLVALLSFCAHLSAAIQHQLEWSVHNGLVSDFEGMSGIGSRQSFVYMYC